MIENYQQRKALEVTTKSGNIATVSAVYSDGIAPVSYTHLTLPTTERV